MMCKLQINHSSSLNHCPILDTGCFNAYKRQICHNPEATYNPVLQNIEFVAHFMIIKDLKNNPI